MWDKSHDVNKNINQSSNLMSGARATVQVSKGLIRCHFPCRKRNSSLVSTSFIMLNAKSNSKVVFALAGYEFEWRLCS